MSAASVNNETSSDEAVLAAMGYRQELARRMSGFSNFAISFAIICILAGGITAFPLGLSSAGGASIGIGWPLGALFSLVVALGMAQIASAYPTAGGLYHWSSILGGRGWGWATAWYNLLGVIFVSASVIVGFWLVLRDLILVGMLGMNPDQLGVGVQVVAVALITISQALLNALGIRITTRLTDFSGYLIFTVAIVLTIALALYAKDLDFSRLFTFTNFTGAAGGDVWPQTNSLFMAFLSGLILVCYTITGFDASAHTSEETANATRNVPKGMVQSVVYSALFGYLMICAFVLAMPSVTEGAKQGYGVFGWLMSKSDMPTILRNLLFIGIVVANYLCGLAAITSTSRMMYAFARDGGMPFSDWLKSVDPKHKTPIPAIILSSLLIFAITLYTPLFSVLAAGSAVLLYISYIMPVAAGLFAEGRTWHHFGTFRLGMWSKPVAVLGILGGLVLSYASMRPPFEKVAWVVLGLAAILALVWFVAERYRFAGPPQTHFADDAA